MLREKTPEYRIEPVGMGLRIGLARESRKMSISSKNNPINSVELLSSWQIFLVSLMIVVSRGEDFTPVARMQPFQNLISQD